MDIREAVERFEKMRDKDVPLLEVSRELGISMATLRRWEADRRRMIVKDSERQVPLDNDFIPYQKISVWRDVCMVLARLSLGVVGFGLIYKFVHFVCKAVSVFAGY